MAVVRCAWNGRGTDFEYNYPECISDCVNFIYVSISCLTNPNSCFIHFNPVLQRGWNIIAFARNCKTFDISHWDWCSNSNAAAAIDTSNRTHTILAWTWQCYEYKKEKSPVINLVWCWSDMRSKDGISDREITRALRKKDFSDLHRGYKRENEKMYHSVSRARLSGRNDHQTGCVSFRRWFSEINEPPWKRPASSPPRCRKQNASPRICEMLLNGICVHRALRARTRSSGPKLLDRAFCLWSLLRLVRTKGCPPVSIRFRLARAFLPLSVSLSFFLVSTLITPLFVAAALFFEFWKLQEHCFASTPPG